MAARACGPPWSGGAAHPTLDLGPGPGRRPGRVHGGWYPPVPPPRHRLGTAALPSRPVDRRCSWSGWSCRSFSRAGRLMSLASLALLTYPAARSLWASPRWSASWLDSARPTRPPPPPRNRPPPWVRSVPSGRCQPAPKPIPGSGGSIAVAAEARKPPWCLRPRHQPTTRPAPPQV